MTELSYINKVLNFNHISYEVIDIQATSNINVLVTIQNEVYLLTIALVANETTINGVIQTSSDMIMETLSN